MGRPKNYIAALEKEWKNLPKLRLAGFLKKNLKGLDLKGFLENFFHKWNHEYETRWIDSGDDEETMGKHRSIQDIYCISRYYYPESTLEDVCRALFELCKENKLAGKWFCKQTKRYVFNQYPEDYDSHCVRDAIFAHGTEIKSSDVYKQLRFTIDDFVNPNYENDEDDEDNIDWDDDDDDDF